MSSKKYFDHVAKQWDSMRSNFFSENVREKVLSAAGVKKGQTAADIGAGTGFLTEGLLKRGLKVIAVDESEAMLKEMKIKFGADALLESRVGESEKLPLDDETVDFSFSNMYLHHVESPFTAIQEMTRILRHGGKLVLTDIDEHTHEFLRTEQHDRWLGFKRDDIRNWLKKAGLRNGSVDCVGENCCSDSACGCESANISIFIAMGEK